ncbi:PD-(D/E)XK nuclease family protein, partial [uncultured Campylobacter sp.]|uniref:PDDEXK-like family protein n=1 Tax=uncultured Campylobacter sp. TaxID=218934 RepID=UPI0025E15B91
MAKNDLEILKEFINDKEAQEKFNAIKNSVMDFNIFEITGLGNQEIKHSNTLAWLFGDNEHGLRYQILEGFLKFTLENSDNTLESYENLEKYLKTQEKNIRVFRESDNIDLLLIDENNKLVITIENKVEADEGKEQLLKYRKFIDDKYKDFERIYIFLTKDGRLPEDKTERGRWLIATYKTIGDSIECSLQNNKLSQKANIILSSYVDLLKRRNIMGDKELQNLCEQIWDKYEKELQILISYKRTKLDKLFEAIKNTLEERGIEIYKDSRLNNLYLIRTKNADYIYNFMYSKNAKEANKERKYAIDIQFNITKEEYIWIGYDGSYK